MSSTDQAKPPTPPPCPDVSLERNRFFTGKFLTARDCRVEQEYLLTRRYLHNRLLHGWGIACGLDVRRHPDYPSKTECGLHFLTVEPGIALDSCGRELILKERRFIILLPKWYEDENPTYEPAASAETDRVTLEPGVEYLLCLQYDEHGVEKAYPLCEEEGQTEEVFNHVCERPRLVVLKTTDVPGCWPNHPPAESEKPKKAEPPAEVPCCVKPCHPCGEKAVVPLALLTPRTKEECEGSEDKVLVNFEMCGRTYLPGKGLTTLVGCNWKHGEKIPLDKLDGKLDIVFSKGLLDNTHDPRSGVNEYTFLVQYGGIQQLLEFLPFPDDDPPRLVMDEQGRPTARFTIDPDYLVPNGRRSIVGRTVYVTLKCDFVLDCDGRAVDGNHLRGQLPTGDGVEGGTFESWFTVGPPEEKKGEAS